MKLDKTDNLAIQEMQLLSGIPTETIQRVWIAFLMYFLLSHKEGEKARLPYFGDFFAKYKGDIEVDGGIEANISVFFDAHPTLKRVVGQSEDEDRTGMPVQNDLYKWLMGEIKHSLSVHHQS